MSNVSQTMPNPCFFNPKDPALVAQSPAICAKLKKTSTRQLQKNIATAKARVENKIYELQCLSEDIPSLILKIHLSEKLLQHRKADEQRLAVIEEQQAMVLMERLQLEEKEQALKRGVVLTRPTKALENEGNTPANFQAESIQICLKDVTGKSHYVTVVISTTIDDLYNHVFNGFPQPKEDLYLRTLDGVTLQLGKSWAEQGVTKPMTTIHMMIRQRGGAKKNRSKPKKVKLRNFNDKIPFTLEDLLFVADEKDLDYLFELQTKHQEEDVVSLGSEDSERSGAEEEYKRDNDPDYDPTQEEGDEGDESEFDNCQHEWLNRAGECFECGDYATTPQLSMKEWNDNAEGNTKKKKDF
jgi:hypothetical protein